MTVLKSLIIAASLAFSGGAVSVSGAQASSGQAELSVPSRPHIAAAPVDGAWPTLGWVEQTDNFIQQRYHSAADAFEADWGQLPQMQLATGIRLAEGATGPAVAALRMRLGLPAGEFFDAALGDTIARYRRAHGLSAGRTADATLYTSLNRGHAYYKRIVDANVLRVMSLPGDLGERFLLVDSAEQQLHFFEGQSRVNTMKVVVGTADNQTPVVASKLDHVVLNPYWNVPPDLTRDRYAARVISGGKNYLTTRGFEALSDFTESARTLGYNEVDWRAVQRGDVTLRLRQKPGPGNGMGEIKFMFANPYGVYLHDTPSKHLFGKDERLFSAGCVRVERPWELAEWLFGHRPTTSSSEPEQAVYLPEPVPVFLVYFTAIPNGTGFDFREDHYSLDRSLGQPLLR